MSIDMEIFGKYRDEISKGGEVIADSGWKSNTIVIDCGRLLAAMMKKDLKNMSGVEYIAFGSGNTDYLAFKLKIIQLMDDFFKGSDKTVKVKYSPNSTSEWVWAKKLDSSTITYLKSPDITDLGQMASGITNRLEIRVTVDENEPTQDSFDFKEFALFSIDGMDISKIFFINYVSHPGITKTKDMTRKLTIDLAFLAKK